MSNEGCVSRHILLSVLNTRFPELQYHVVLTERSNLCCGYCGGTRHIEELPLEVAYDVGILANFMNHDHEAVIGARGGRCLFANKTTFWGAEWFKRVCVMTRHMIRDLGTLVEPTKKLMKDGTLKLDALDYPRINNGCEIIP